MSIANQQQSEYYQQLADYNADIQSYTSTVNEYMEDAQSQQNKFAEMSQMLQNSGFLALEVVGKIVGSKAFALLTTAVMKSGVFDGAIAKLKSGLKPVIKSVLGIDVDKPSNFAWKEAFDAVDYKSAMEMVKAFKNQDIGEFKRTFTNLMTKAVVKNSGKITSEGLKLLGLDVESPENKQYIAQIKDTGITFDDLISAGKGDLQPLAAKVEPILRDAVMAKVSKEFKLPEFPEGEPSPFKNALKTLNLEDVQNALKGNFSGVTEKLKPVVMDYVQDKLQEKFGIDLKSTGESSLDLPLSINDIKRAMTGDYGGIIDSLKPQLQKVVQDKIKEATGIDLNTKSSGTPITLDDVKELSKGNFQPLIDKYKPQVQKYITDKIKEKFNIPVSESDLPVTLDDLQELSKGNYQPLLDKYKPQIEKYVSGKIKDYFGMSDIDTSHAPITTDDLKLIAQGRFGSVLSKYEPQIKDYLTNKIKENTGLDINLDDAESPIGLTDLREVAKGNYGGVLSKFEPQIREQISQQLADKLGVNVAKYQTQLEDLPIAYSDITSASKGDYKPILAKLQTKVENESGIKAEDLQAAYTQTKTQSLQMKAQAKTQIKEGVSQARTQVAQAQQQVEEGVAQTRQEVAEGVAQARTQAQIVYTERPTYDPTRVNTYDAYPAFRASTATMAKGISQTISDTGEGLISKVNLARTTGVGIAGSLAGLGASIGVGLGSSQIQSEAGRDVTQVGGTAVAGAAISGISKFAQSDATMGEALTESAIGGAQMGVLVGAQIGISYIPDRTARFATGTALNAGMTGYVVYQATPTLRAMATSQTAQETAETSAQTGAETSEGMEMRDMASYEGSAGEAGGEAGAEAGAEAAGEVGAEATVDAGLATAELASTTVDAIPVVGEIVQVGIGLAALGSSLYFGLKDLFDDSTPPPQPVVAQPSEQFGI